MTLTLSRMMISPPYRLRIPSVTGTARIRVHPIFFLECSVQQNRSSRSSCNFRTATNTVLHGPGYIPQTDNTILCRAFAYPLPRSTLNLYTELCVLFLLFSDLATVLHCACYTGQLRRIYSVFTTLTGTMNEYVTTSLLPLRYH